MGSGPLLSSLGLRMDDSVAHVVIGLHLGVTLCRPHLCQRCGVVVTHLGTYDLRCRKSQGRFSRYLQ